MIKAIQHTRFGLLKLSKSFLINGDGLILVDTGYSPGCAGNVLEALNEMGKAPGDIEICIITHSHRDHIGALKVLKEVCGFEVASHSAEAKAIEKATEVRVDRMLEDGGTLPHGGGTRVIHMPGHTAGNISLVVGNTLIAGDTLFRNFGRITPPPSFFSADQGQAVSSVSKLAEYEFDTIMFSHGGVIKTGGKKALLGLLEKLGHA